MMYGIFSLTAFRIFEVFDPVGEALQDFRLTDLVFSELREQPPADTNVVLVNFGELPRAGIAEIVRIVNKYDPAVIGIDSFFPDLKEESPEGDSILATVLSEVENLVMVSRVEGFDESSGEYTVYYHSHDTFLTTAETAIANLITSAAHQEDMKVVRSFPKSQTVNGIKEYAFASKLVSFYDPDKFEKFKKRPNAEEVINWRGNIVDPYSVGADQYAGRFFALDVGDIFSENFTPELIKGKIVIIGYMGRDLWDTSWDDKFYTPINKTPAGRANPDMYGPVVHANITSMILHEDYVNAMSEEMGLWLALILCYANVLVFLKIYRKLPKWYDGLTKLIQLIESLFLVFFMMLFFHWFSYNLDLTVAIVAVLLAGDLIEVYNGVLKNLFNKEQRKLLFQARD
jgi:CHASE2 domain-containing sensor protein